MFCALSDHNLFSCFSFLWRGESQSNTIRHKQLPPTKDLGCVLLQDEKFVCYASQSLNKTEQNYSNIKHKPLVACWSLEKYNHYKEIVILQTDHKLLESIWKKTSASLLPCLQRLILRLLKDGINVKYIREKKNVVKALSCVSMIENLPTEMIIPVIAVDIITCQLPSTVPKLIEIW